MLMISQPELDAEALIAEARAERRRRWRRNGLVVVATLVAVAAAVGGIAAAGASSKPAAGQPFTSAATITWHAVGAAGWDEGAPPNLALAQSSSITCAGAATCFVEVQAYGYQPDGSPTVPGTVPGLAPFRTTGYRSSDDGRRWSRLSLPADTYLSSPISCASALRCAVGARVGTTATSELGSAALVLTTTDGGRSWQRHRLPGWVALATSVACPTASRCVTVVEASTRGTIGARQPWDGANQFFASDVLTTHDGGRTWAASPLPGRSGHHALSLDTLSCPTAQDCVVAGERAAIVPRPAAQYVIGATTGVVLASVDGGRTFASRTVPAVPLLASCPTPTSCLALARGPEPGSAMVLDGSVGGRWRVARDRGFPTQLATVPSLTCPTAGHCLAIAGADQLEVTADGGRTWQAGMVAATSPAAHRSVVPGVAPLGSACTTSGRCVVLAIRSPSAGTAVGPTHLQVLVDGR